MKKVLPGFKEASNLFTSTVTLFVYLTADTQFPPKAEFGIMNTL